MTNLGVEMVYILEQRLKAQQIPKEKATEFLKDVVLTMFEANFYSEVFRPQEVYTIGATRQIFDRLAHSSIMRLSTSSMDKLYDLMLMGLKYQMLCIRKPSDILKVTQLHLNNVKRMVEDQEVQARINDVLQFTESTYSGFSALNWIQLRQALARFLKDKRVKVSLFLQEGIQTQEGKILLPLPLPENPSVPQPGTLNILNDAGEVQSVKTFRMESVEVDTALFHCHPHSLGDNLYDKSRPPFMPPTSRSAAKAASPHVTRDDAGINSPKTFAKPARREITTGNAEAMLAAGVGDAGKEELNALARLIAPRNAGDDNFKLNLFPDDDKDAPVATDISSAFEPVVRTITIDHSSGKGNRQHLDKLMSDMDVKDSADDDEDDLLALMDKAS